VETFKEHEVQLLIAAMPEIGGRAFDSLILHMLASFAEFEREMIAEGIADTRAGLIARDRRIAGEVPFGYSADSRTKQLVPIETEAVNCP
jgi:DNA invertase Pin-like site-specific DNA recombinase